METTSKLSILESLDEMDHAQMEKVMDYIRKVLEQEANMRTRKMRRLGMEQIRSALQPQQLMRPQF